MIKNLTYFLLLYSCWLFGQSSLSAKLIGSTPLNCDRFVGVDQFESLYYLKSRALFKNINQESISYSNLSNGDISSVSIFNPLKLVLLSKKEMLQQSEYWQF